MALPLRRKAEEAKEEEEKKKDIERDETGVLVLREPSGGSVAIVRPKNTPQSLSSSSLSLSLSINCVPGPALLGFFKTLFFFFFFSPSTLLYFNSSKIFFVCVSRRECECVRERETYHQAGLCVCAQCVSLCIFHKNFYFVFICHFYFLLRDFVVSRHFFFGFFATTGSCASFFQDIVPTKM